MDINSKLLKQLVSIYAPSGDEAKIRDFIRGEISEYVDEISTDSMGNLICRKRGAGKRIMVAAHMDQIGVMATKIEDEGYVRFTNIGGINPYASLNKTVTFENGIVGVIDKNGKSEYSKLKLEDLYIDIGAKDKQDAQDKICIGDSAVYTSDYLEDEHRIITGALDNRIGCYIAIESIKTLAKNDNDIYYVFTTQEELGLRGATTSSYSIEPDFAIAVDITGSGDTPEDDRLAIALGKGTAIKVKDRGIVVDPRVKRYMVAKAREKGIDYQLEILEYGATDSGAIHLSRSGVLTGVISVPTRYVHSPVETIDKRDVHSSINLLNGILESDIDFV